MLEIEKTNVKTDDLISETLKLPPMDDEEIFGFKTKYFQNIHLAHQLFEELNYLSENRINLEKKSILLKNELSKYEDFNIQIRDELNLRNDQKLDVFDFKKILEKTKSIKEKFPNLS